MLPVDVSCNHTFVIAQRFLCKFKCYLVSKLGLDVIALGEALHKMVVQPAACLAVHLLGEHHFVVGILG